MRDRSPSTSTVTGDAKRRRPDSPVNPETDGDAVCDSIVTSKNHYDVGEDGYPAIPSDPVEALTMDIKNFDEDRRVFETLRILVDADDEVMTLWFDELRAKWNDSEPTSPEQASRAVFLVLQKYYCGFIRSHIIEGMMLRYGLPDWRKLQQPGDWDIDRILYPESSQFDEELIEQETVYHEIKMKDKQEEVELCSQFDEELIELETVYHELKMKEIQEEVEDIEKRREEKQKEKEDAEKKLKKKQTKLEDAEKKLKKKQTKLEDAEKKMKKKQKELEDVEKELERKLKEIEDAVKYFKFITDLCSTTNMMETTRLQT